MEANYAKSLKDLEYTEKKKNNKLRENEKNFKSYLTVRKNKKIKRKKEGF